MSGHSKWHNIQARKGKSDAQRGKIFTKIGREIAVVVKTGGADPVSNSKLRDVIAKAKQNNMPNDSIQRAIKKATGELSNVNYEETTYEGYGVGGSAVIVECLTDNKNRTAGDVRHTFDKHGGSLGATGCVSYLFKRKGVIILEKKEGLDSDEILMQALEAGAKDVLEDEDSFTIETAPDELNSVVESLNKNGIEVLEYSVEQVPDMYVELDEAKQTQFEKMIDALEDLDDVQNVYHNVK
ncbi:MAG TPA: YebC/PmpR family DNA-binding transcriptional regulator [Candidatus Caccopulliclostridium gallistercoris]|uniref:Probable transcriptional regulatory protein IAA62_03715 n=1 Tax=Candidatus Caccopulliclostridium gallistercoris TaxID=2840719 RepID=A0A9D1NFB5_9FIRM|nr:YebC/PmpR family DNA-binding transcriptional regulator [Candidatus Caccopulliclostridium gallistercoris]